MHRFRIASRSMPTIERIRLRRALWSAYPAVRTPLRLPSLRSIAVATCVVTVLALGVRAGCIGYAYASTGITRGDLFYNWRRSEELRRLARMDIATQRAFYYLLLSERRMQEALVHVSRPDDAWFSLVERAFAERRMAPVRRSVVAGLVLEAERTFTRSMELFTEVGIWQDALVENGIRVRDRLREGREDLRGLLGEGIDPVLAEMLARGDDAEAFYMERFPTAASEHAIELFWLDPVAVPGDGPNRAILDLERLTRALPPVLPEGSRT